MRKFQQNLKLFFDMVCISQLLYTSAMETPTAVQSNINDINNLVKL